ncbi:MAG: hypothetical protein K5793_01965 [Nitrosarchaeum sp.]|nr:hypothetical protein [Nitrosarchaeum sp.]
MTWVISLSVILVFLTGMTVDVFANKEMITDDSPGIIMKTCGNNPLRSDYNSETVSGAEIFQRCVEIQEGYSWGSRVYVLIFAPAWNTDPYKLDMIGNDPSNPITATSREGSMTLEDAGCNGFIETGFNHGVFFGSIKLSGFRYDITGDGVPDLFGGNRCERTLSILDDGSGRVETKQDGEAMITWEYFENKYVSKTIKHTWREATLEFDKKTYDVNDEVHLMLNDLDNLRFPFDDDKIYEINVYSDTDGRGITLDALWKTDYKGIPQMSGTYPVKFSLTGDKESNSSRLRVSPGDFIYAEYWDYTLPKPHSIGDRKKITTSAHVNYVDVKSDITVNTKITDGYGNPLHHCNKGGTAIIKTEIANSFEKPLSVSVITQIKNPNGSVEKIQWSTLTIAPDQTSQIQTDWIMKQDGIHKFEVYVWDSIANAKSLHDAIVTEI